MLFRSEDIHMVSNYVNYKIRSLGREILDGTISVNPCELGSEKACTYCAYRQVCGFDAGTEGYQPRRLEKLKAQEALEKIREVRAEDEDKTWELLLRKHSDR